MTPLALLLWGCAAPVELEVALSPLVNTVAVAQWSTPQASVGAVRWGEVGEEDWTGELAEEGPETEEHALVVAGLRPERRYRFDVQVDGAWQDRPVELETGPVPAYLADFEVQGAADAFDGLLPLAMIGAAPGVTIVDAAGEVVWYHRVEETGVQPRRAAWAPDRRQVLLNLQDEEGQTVIRALELDGTVAEEIAVEGHHHDFASLPGGDLLLIVHDTRTVDGVEVEGDALVRRGRDGSEETVFSLWDWFDTEDQPVPNDRDWSHANALDHLPERGLVLLGLRHFDSVLALDDQDWGLAWSVGGRVGSIEPDAEGAFRHQHQVHLLDDDRMLVFDNRTDASDAEVDSRVLELQLDLDGGRAETTWTHHHDPPVQVDALGNVERLSTGDTLVTWTTLGEVQVVAPDGTVRWQLNTVLGTGIGYGDRFDGF